MWFAFESTSQQSSSQLQSKLVTWSDTQPYPADWLLSTLHLCYKMELTIGILVNRWPLENPEPSPNKQYIIKPAGTKKNNVKQEGGNI